ncbi:N-acetylglutamate kinase [Lacibacter cauensis]|uniref:Acetylglutamate kinase n=1 Tax=Lacibacter cauensis TaxID=510947 RepID=A0A562SPS0_9BACT|nr:acetylglutamate kinase [Lacibacter cauensis]TWI83034.1 N-acetylglutamate kinase [Lacibacter cauensis]
MKENMFYGASHLIFQKAEELRNRMTPAEELLWKHIHINEWKLKFRRQHPISNYVVDFYCHAARLVIELDGGIHEVEEVKINDQVRERNLKSLGLTVLRFKNEEVFQNKSTVLKTIKDTIATIQENKQLVIEKEKLVVIKIGGNIVDSEPVLASFLESFSKLVGGHTSPPSGDGGFKAILIHGGGKVATKIGESLGIESKYVDGRRITDAATIDLVTMVYAGLINKKVIAQLQSLGCNAIGVTGADGNLIPANKRPVKEIDYGFVGDVKSDKINAQNWSGLLEHGFIPVVAPITHDGKGQLLNTNADTIAQEVAKAMSNLYEVSLIYSFEKAGVLLDANDDATVISNIDPTSYEQLKAEGKIFAGMIPKLDNAFAALNSGVKKVVIGKAEHLNDLINGESGTSITNS